MSERDIITMSRKEARRLHIIHLALDKKVTQSEAAAHIDVTERQVRRIVKRIREEGDAGISHRSRNKPSNRRIAQKLKDKTLTLFRSRYSDFGPTHASEKLSELHGITLSAETLRQWLQGQNIPYKKRNGRKHRQWRERKKRFGEMVQLDGSHHDWFEGRGPLCVFMGYIDDATNTVFGRFYPYEGTMPALDSFKRYIRRYGIPQSVYVDKHSTYKSMGKETIEDDLLDRKPQSDFEKSLAALSVEVIHAHSPQAKGRVERLFRTLQDRLVKELRLHGINTIEAANDLLAWYLPKHNRRFRRSPAKKGDLHRPALGSRELDDILSVKTERALRNDFTIAHNKKLYQIQDTIRARRVIVQERIDGSRYILYQGKRLRYQEITARPIKQPKATQTIQRIRRQWTPPSNHPWKRSYKPDRKRSAQRTTQAL